MQHLLQSPRIELYLHIFFMLLLIIVIVKSMIFVTSSCWILMMSNSFLIFQIHPTSLFIVFLFILVTMTLRWFTQLNVIFYHFISKNDTFLWPSYPWCFRLYFYYVHIKVFQYFKIKFYWNFRFLYKWNAEINSCSYWCTKWKDTLWENWTKSVLRWKRVKLSLFFRIVWRTFLIKLFQCLLRKHVY